MFSFIEENYRIKKNESIGSTGIKYGKVKSYFNSDYEDSKFEKIRDNINNKKIGKLKCKILGKEKINKIEEEKRMIKVYALIIEF